MDFYLIGLDWGSHREECELKRRWSSVLSPHWESSDTLQRPETAQLFGLWVLWPYISEKIKDRIIWGSVVSLPLHIGC